MKKIMAMIVTLAFALVGLVGVGAAEGDTESCVSQDARAETIEHEAITCDDEPPVEECPEGFTGTVLNCEPVEPPVIECPEGEAPSAGGSCYPCEDFNSETGVCNDDVDPPDDPDNPGVPNTPTDVPTAVSPGVSGVERKCVGNDLMVKRTKANGNSSTYYVAGHSSCDTGEVLKEEGM